MAPLTDRISGMFRRSRGLRVLGLAGPGTFWLLVFFTIPRAHAAPVHARGL